jgi:ferredoxin/flavodoxin
MTKKIQKAFIVYCSPAGTTRHVSQIIARKLQEMKIEVVECDLSKKFSETAVITKINRIKDNACLFVGSPVYVSHAIPPVMNFIARLPKNSQMPAVPFVTWGGATSGVALYEMGKALAEKNMNVVGGAKILALHSMMWQMKDPLGHNHPDEKDDEMIREMTTGIMKKLSTGSNGSINLSALAYYPAEIAAEMEKTTLKKAKTLMPKRKVDEDACTECKECSSACPTDSISFNPYPEFEKNCIFCFNCVRVCPEDAIRADFSKAETRIRARAEQFKRDPAFTDFYIKNSHRDTPMNKTVGPSSPEEKTPWYFGTSFIVIAIGCVGPLALPLVWWHPKATRTWKIGLTIGILILSWILFQTTLESFEILKQYYELLC